MRRSFLRLTLSALVVFLLAAASAAPQTPAAGPAEREAILAALNASAAEWNKGNLDGYMGVYWNSPDLTFSSGANTTRGYQAALDRYKRNYQAPGREMGRLDYRDVQVDILCADTAFVRGSWHLAQSGGKEPHGVFTLLLRKLPGGWKIVHDHSSGE
jgi:beta-aspartyl-peptidase (threonine type)